MSYSFARQGNDETAQAAAAAMEGARAVLAGAAQQLAEAGAASAAAARAAVGVPSVNAAAHPPADPQPTHVGQQHHASSAPVAKAAGALHQTTTIGRPGVVHTASQPPVPAVSVLQAAVAPPTQRRQVE